MNTKSLQLLSYLLLLIFFNSCGDENSPVINESINDINITSPNSDFGHEFFLRVMEKNDSDENILISPYSIQVALYMLVNGLEGNSKKQVLEALGLDENSVNEINKAYAKLYTDLHTNKETEFISNNALFYDANRVDVLSDYKQAIENSYLAEILNEDFSKAETAKSSINQWIENNTEGKIKKLIENIKPEDVAFILNAIYFKSNWANGFPVDYTSEGDFYLRNGAVDKVNYMRHDAMFKYHVAEDHFVLNLPFSDSVFSMTFLGLRDENIGIEGWITQNWDMFQSSLELLTEERAYVTLPKLDITYKTSLIPSLRDMGIEDIFQSSSCDLSNFGSSKIGSLYVSQVEHKATLVMDEKGVEGAAVTSIGVGVTSAPPSLTFDKPFLLVLRHKSTDIPIFMGIVNNPSKD